MSLTSHIPPIMEAWDEFDSEELPRYTPSTLPFYHVLAAHNPVSVYVFRQPTQRQRLVIPTPECLTDDESDHHAYLITAKRGPSMFRVVSKSADLELTRVRLEDFADYLPEPTRNLRRPGIRRHSSSTLSVSQSRHSISGADLDRRRILFRSNTTNHSIGTPPGLTLHANASTLTLTPTTVSSRSSLPTSSTSLIANLYTRPQISPAPWHPHLHLTYLRNPMSPIYITLHAPSLVNFRLSLSPCPPSVLHQQNDPAAQKYYAWKLTTYPTMAHSLLDRRGTCVARFVYGNKGTYASKLEEIGRLEIYDPKLPQLDRSRQDVEDVDDWTEVIIATCDLVVQYWRKMGRRYSSYQGKAMGAPTHSMRQAPRYPGITTSAGPRFPQNGYVVA